MILLIDNYDSFTWNVVHLLQKIGAEVTVKRNDELTVKQAMQFPADAIVLSPGPCTPNEAGICVPLVREALNANRPLLGICLGHQSITAAMGGVVCRAATLMHGKTSLIDHVGNGLFQDIDRPFTATRYHSLIAEQATLPNNIRVTARSQDDQEIMALEVIDSPIVGVQFHPESIATEFGDVMMRNFLHLSRSPKGALAA